MAKSKKKTRYAVVGTGGRCLMFIDPICSRFPETSELVGLCDSNPGRLQYHIDRLQEKFQYGPVPTYDAKDFVKMIKETKPDVVIVTTVDAFHHEYIIKAMELGCDAITEKPMTIDDKKCRAIYKAIEKTGRKLRVTFNYRWGPGPTLVKQLLSKGTIGEILHVDFEYLLNTDHGADYFRRWHREKDKSGGLMVHKSTHHFDLVNWWINAVPDTVFGFGRLGFYGAENAKKRGVKANYDHYTGAKTEGDPFALDMEKSAYLKKLYLDPAKYDGYRRDRNVFAKNIDIEDSMSVLVKYRTGAVLNYSLNAYLPREGFHVAFNGTQGRIEYHEFHYTHIPGGPRTQDVTKHADLDWRSKVVVHPMFKEAYEVPIPKAEGGHGGSDPLLAEQIFSAKPPKELWGRNAGPGQGAASILIGIAANQCFKSGKPIKVGKLLPAISKQIKLSELE